MRVLEHFTNISKRGVQELRSLEGFGRFVVALAGWAFLLCLSWSISRERVQQNGPLEVRYGRKN